MLFYQPIKGYCFNSDSIFLYDFITLFKPKGNLLDIGSGVGILSLLLARDFSIQPFLVEKQSIMAKYAEKNAQINGIKAAIYIEDFLKFNPKGQFDFIVSNPPFYHNDVIKSKNEHLNICRYNYNLPLEPFFKKVKSVLKPRGHFIFCYDSSQIVEILTLSQKYSLTVEHIKFVHPKISKKAKLILVHIRNNSKAKTVTLPPLITFKDNEYTNEVKEIFKKARTHTIKCTI